MPLPQNIPINITPENVWAALDAVESDFEDDLADVRVLLRAKMIP